LKHSQQCILQKGSHGWEPQAARCLSCCSTQLSAGRGDGGNCMCTLSLTCAVVLHSLLPPAAISAQFEAMTAHEPPKTGKNKVVSVTSTNAGVYHCTQCSASQNAHVWNEPYHGQRHVRITSTTALEANPATQDRLCPSAHDTLDAPACTSAPPAALSTPLQQTQMYTVYMPDNIHV
jgi:hypothetical protein